MAADFQYSTTPTNSNGSDVNGQATPTPTTSISSLTNQHISSSSTYNSLHTYPFQTDTGFLAGLSQILGHPNQPPTEDELDQNPDLVLSAKCFYFNRKFQPSTPTNAQGYKAWLQTQSSPRTGEPQPPQSTPNSTSAPQLESPTTPIPPSTTTTTSTSIQTPPPPPPQPPYPTSFAAIVELITTNKPIPGIEEIPTTILEHGSSKQDRATRRKKPWEKQDDEEEHRNTILTNTTLNATEQKLTEDIDETTLSSVNGDSKTRDTHGQDEGLLRLLRPDHVPDSGLIAKE